MLPLSTVLAAEPRVFAKQSPLSPAQRRRERSTYLLTSRDVWQKRITPTTRSVPACLQSISNSTEWRRDNCGANLSSPASVRLFQINKKIKIINNLHCVKVLFKKVSVCGGYGFNSKFKVWAREFFLTCVCLWYW